MDRDCLPPVSVTLGESNEISNDFVFGAGTVRKFHLVDFDGVAREIGSIVQLVVEADDPFYIQVDELVYEVVWAGIITDTGSSGVHGILRR